MIDDSSSAADVQQWLSEKGFGDVATELDVDGQALFAMSRSEWGDATGCFLKTILPG